MLMSHHGPRSQMISAARLEEETMEDAAENLKRQRAARRRSSSDMVIQVRWYSGFWEIPLRRYRDL